MPVIPLNSFVFPSDLGVRRDYMAAAEHIDEAHKARYDRYTLFYDAFWDAAGSEVVLICPTLLNFAPFFAGEMQFEDVEGGALSPRVAEGARYHEVRFPSAKRVEALRMMGAGFEAEVPVSAQTFDLFRGHNVIMTLQKDNPLTWVRDWLRYHVEVHGATAALIFDNGSTRYSPRELEAEMGLVRGLTRAVVVPAAFPHGPHHPPPPKKSASKFLQISLFNLARLRFLRQARAVLNADIDELVAPVKGSTVFDRTVRSVMGYRRFGGRWRETDMGAAAERGFRDSVLIPADEACKNEKWCINPRGLLANAEWLVHNVKPRNVVPFKVTALDGRLSYYHMRGMSTKRQSEAGANAHLPVDTELQALLSRTLRV
ncbi:MAG: hypothetical protein AAFQ36_04750 [Pseudomonadota bacterium]